jgi:hypothetical protein
MTLKHSFIDNDGLLVNPDYVIDTGDVCVYCGFVVDKKIKNIFKQLLDKHSTDSNIDEYDSDLNFCYLIVNKKHPCITEEEYMIKKALE